MTEILRELTTVKKASEITSEQVLTLFRREEAQRAQKMLTEATKSNMEFDAIQR